MNILIVEDDVIVANVYRNKLAVEGYTVEVVTDGEAALSILSSFKADVMLLDLMLPKIPGLEVLKKVRESEQHKNLPVFVFSNTYLSSMVQSAWKAGATKCISKANCTPRQLLELLRTLETPGATSGAPVDASAHPAPATHTRSSAPAAPVINSKVTDSMSQEEIKRRFSTMLPGLLSAMRPLLQAANKVEGSAGAQYMGQMHHKMRALTGGAGVAGFSRVAQMCAAVEALLKELHEKPQNINKSTLRTIAFAVDFIAILLAPGELTEKEISSFGNILVVDDEPMSRRAVAFALEKASLNSISVGSPEIALQLLEDNKFDLVFLDIDMPNINGLELCSRLRAMEAHKKTPVVFVTALNDFDNRANSMMSGGNDLIGKPFLFMELAVKALCYALRSRLEGPKAPANNRTALLAAVLQS